MDLKLLTSSFALFFLLLEFIHASKSGTTEKFGALMETVSSAAIEPMDFDFSGINLKDPFRHSTTDHVRKKRFFLGKKGRTEGNRGWGQQDHEGWGQQQHGGWGHQNHGGWGHQEHNHHDNHGGWGHQHHDNHGGWGHQDNHHQHQGGWGHQGGGYARR